MTATAQAPTLRTTTLAAEDFKVGYRYWAVRPGYEQNWTVTDVTPHTADYQVYRDGQFITPELITITYGDGRTRTFEKGEQIAIQGPWLTPECPDCGHVISDTTKADEHHPKCPQHDPHF